MRSTRRTFIQCASLAAAGNIAGLRTFGSLNALAQSSTGYKALVCVFLYGGNDSNNMVVPFDATGYAAYAQIRGPLAIQQKQLLQLGALPNFSLHPGMSELRSLFDSQAAAIVANVGTLTQPTTKAQYVEGVQLPNNLFSHVDQQREWQNASQSSATRTGWAGRMNDLLNATYNPNSRIPMITSVDGDTIFCDSQTGSPLSIVPGHLGGMACRESTLECATQQQVEQSLLTFDSGLSLVQADNSITNNAYTYAKTITDAVSSVAPLQTVFPTNNSLASQLQQIAQIIQVRASLGVQRQIFFAGIGNFDTHANQLPLQGALISQLSAGLAAFNQATIELGVQSNVTSFTMSDFSRSFQPNTSSGSDHAWGGHHLVMGGAVQGGRMYGTFPTLALNGPDDSGSNGRWIPSTASAQYAATLASWFGVSASQMTSIFPNIGSFTSRNLGFV